MTTMTGILRSQKLERVEAAIGFTRATAYPLREKWVCEGERIPQPEGWGAFTSAYRKRAGGFLQSPNRKVGVP
jgi:hypothetical protein